MAVDYLILKDCKVKEQLPNEQLVETIKDRNRAFQVRDMLAKTGKNIEEINNFKFTLQKLGPNGAENINYKIGELIEKSSILDQLSINCQECPVSNGESFGCLGAINYPISAKCENWIARMADQSYKKGEVYAMMITFILDQKIKGTDTENARREGNRFFELNKPVEIVLSKSFFSKKAINTNQLIEMILGFRVMQFTHMNHLLMLFGGCLLTENQPTDRPSKFNKDQNKYMYSGLELPQDADKSIHDFYNLFQKIFLTMVNNVEISFDR